MIEVRIHFNSTISSNGWVSIWRKRGDRDWNWSEHPNPTQASLARLMYVMAQYGATFRPYSVRITSEPPSPEQTWYLSAFVDEVTQKGV